MEILLILVAVLAGAGLPLQAGANATMRTFLGRPEWAAVVNFVVGLVALLAWLIVSRAQWPAVSAFGRAPWWAWVGGFVGAYYVAAVVVLAPRLGVATTLALTIAAQMGSALVFDHFGWLGFAIRPITAGRLVGVALLVAGVVLVRR